MNVTCIKKLVDCCFTAKRITETMEELPYGFKPRHIHVIDCIFCLGQHKQDVRVSDVSAELSITTPSVTKLLNELENKGAITKYSLDSDKRVTLLKLTELGNIYEEKYVTKYHKKWAQNLIGVTDEQAEMAIAVIEKLQRAMPKYPNEV